MSDLKLLKFPVVGSSERLTQVLKDISKVSTLEEEHAYVDTLFIVLINYIAEFEGIEYEYLTYDLMKAREIFDKLIFIDED